MPNLFLINSTFRRRKINGKKPLLSKKDTDPSIFVLVKKVLIITYYWPPSGGGGVQRWLKFAKYLREYGWEPVIYTPENPDFELRDDSLASEVPENIEVLKQPIWEPFSLYRRLLGKKAVRQQGVVGKSPSLLSRLAVWIRGNYFIPDSRVFWVRPSTNFLTRYLRQNKVDALVTTGPPHSVHLIGLELKKRTAISWLADFRDPWSRWDVLDQLSLSRKSRKSHEKLEKQVLSNADLVLTVSPTLEKSLQDLGAQSTCLITNGYDNEVIASRITKPEKFRISHLGLLNDGRNPEILWQVLNDLCSSDPGFNDSLEIFMAGTVEDEVIQSLERYGNLRDKFINVGYRSHEEIIGDYEDSALFLLLINNTSNAKWILPGKMFEYIGQGKPILALGNPDSDASNVLEEAGYNMCLSYDDADAMREFILENYNNFKLGEPDQSAGNIEKFHRKELTRALASCLDNLK